MAGTSAGFSGKMAGITSDVVTVVKSGAGVPSSIAGGVGLAVGVDD